MINDTHEDVQCAHINVKLKNSLVNNMVLNYRELEKTIKNVFIDNLNVPTLLI